MSVIEQGATTASVAVVCGEPGIGKSTLLAAAVRVARERGWLALGCRPTEPEAGLAFAALGDLFGGIVAEFLPSLPRPQRRAIEVALLLDEADRTPPEFRAIALGVLGVIRMQAAERPLLIAIDDAQWLDRSTSSALAYAVRRLSDEHVTLVISTRSDAPNYSLPDVLSTLASEGRTTIEVSALTVGALHSLVRVRTGGALPRPLLVRVHEASGGNPLYALELARAYRDRSLTPGEPLEIPRQRRDLLLGRFEGLSPRALEVLFAVAAHGDPTVTVLATALPRATGVRARLREASMRKLVDVSDGHVRFTHPLLAAAAYGAVDASTRRRLHARLAAIVVDPEERGRHLALAASAPDASVASALDLAAGCAEARGAPAAAAELFELGASLSPSGAVDDRHRRLILAAVAHRRAGETDAARALLTQLSDELTPGPPRADVLRQLAECSETDEALALCELALAQAEGDRACRSRIELLRSQLWWFQEGEIERALEAGERALALARQSGDDEAIVAAAANLAGCQMGTGTIGTDVLEPALVAEGRLVSVRVFNSPRLTLALLRLRQGRLSEGRALLETLLETANAHGDERSRIGVLGRLAELEWRAGRWELAHQYAKDVSETWEQIMGRQGAWPLYLTALIAAHRGRVDDARWAAQAGLATAVADGLTSDRLESLSVLAFLDLSAGDTTLAAAAYREILDDWVAHGWALAFHPFTTNALEALTAGGQLDHVHDLLGRFEREADALDSDLGRAGAVYCHALVASAAGDVAAARIACLEAIEFQEQGEWPFERARTLLTLGRIERRARQQGAARTRLAEAATEFDRLGATVWAERAQAELGRIGGRVRGSGLTPAERRVAALVVDGLTNREVASALFISEKTVETHLAHAYAKLGVRSRTALARELR